MAHDEVKQFLQEAWDNNDAYEGDAFADAKTAYDSAKSSLEDARKAIDGVKR
jgi:hypothetical protein